MVRFAGAGKGLLPMLDVVSALRLQTTALRPEPQGAVAVNPLEPAQTAPDQGFVSSSIRVDNLQNVAILEYRSEKGEIIQQYPTQSQIDAFKRAASLQDQGRVDDMQQQSETGDGGAQAVVVAIDSRPASLASVLIEGSVGGTNSVLV